MRLPFLLAASAVLAATCLVASGPLHAWILKGRFRSVDEIAAAKNLIIVRVPARDPNLRPLRGMDNVMDFETEARRQIPAGRAAGHPQRQAVAAVPLGSGRSRPAAYFHARVVKGQRHEGSGPDDLEGATCGRPARDAGIAEGEEAPGGRHSFGSTGEET